MPGVKGKGGPKPKPAKLLEIRGSRWAKARAAHEPATAPEIPPCPAWLTPQAKQTWHHVTKHLHTAGLLGRIDQNALGRYCALLWRWREAEAAITAHGLVKVFKDEDGNIIGEEFTKYATYALNVADRLLRLEQHFGMTPSARAGLGIALGKKHGDTDGAANTKNKDRFFRVG